MGEHRYGVMIRNESIKGRIHTLSPVVAPPYGNPSLHQASAPNE